MARQWLWFDLNKNKLLNIIVQEVQDLPPLSENYVLDLEDGVVKEITKYIKKASRE